VLAVKGRVRSRPEGMHNPNLATGDIEIEALELKLLNVSQTPPFEVEDRVDPAEGLRLKYRYLDLRRPEDGQGTSSCATARPRPCAVTWTAWAFSRSRRPS